MGSANSPNPFDHHHLRNLRNGQMILGYRFNTDLVIDHVWQDTVWGGITHQVDAIPVAGPFFYQHNPDQPWVRHQVKCAGCEHHSKPYRILHYGLFEWARNHRCEARVELNHASFQRSGSMGTIEYNRLYGLPWNR